jgi:hypothetical protein
MSLKPASDVFAGRMNELKPFTCADQQPLPSGIYSANRRVAFNLSSNQVHENYINPIEDEAIRSSHHELQEFRLQHQETAHELRRRDVRQNMTRLILML